MAAQYLGEAAAVITSTLWTGNSIFFTAAGKRIGAVMLNAIRIVIAVALLTATHIIFFGTLVPEANSAQWFWGTNPDISSWTRLPRGNSIAGWSISSHP